MGIFSKFFGRKNTDNGAPAWRVGGTEDFMTLIRVYYQAVLAANFGLHDLRMLPDLRVKLIRVDSSASKSVRAASSSIKGLGMRFAIGSRHPAPPLAELLDPGLVDARSDELEVLQQRPGAEEGVLGAELDDSVPRRRAGVGGGYSADRASSADALAQANEVYGYLKKAARFDGALKTTVKEIGQRYARPSRPKNVADTE